MKNSHLAFAAIIMLGLTLTSCEVIGDIFGAGVYTGIFLVVAVIIFIVVVVLRSGKKN